MSFIPANHKGYTIDPDYKQVFQNKWTLNIAHNDIVKMKNNGYITDRDMKIIKFLFRFKFATAEMIFRYLNEDAKIENVVARLEKLVKSRILNKFMLSKTDADTLSPDALHIYCLDVGGKTLLTHYSNEDTTNWYTTENMKGSEVISKNLVTTNFYIRLLQTCPEKLVYFKQNPEYRIGRINVVPSFEMGMKVNGSMKYYIGQVVRGYDYPMYFREMITKIESVLCTNAWKKYYFDSEVPPLLFLLTENDENALEVAKMTAGTTAIEMFRITTDQRMMLPLYEAGAFLKHAKDKDEKDILKAVRATTFEPKDSQSNSTEEE